MVPENYYFKILLLLSLLPTFYGDIPQSRGEQKLPIEDTECREDIHCPPWGECRHNQCVCMEQLEDYYAVRCSKTNNTLQLSVIDCHCVTFDNETKQLFEGSCIENCQVHEKKDQQYLPLPTETYKLNQFMCVESWNRTGRLCGKCLPGYSPLAYSYDMRCVKCPEGNRNVWKYILIAFGPLTIFYFIVLFFKINATSSHLHGYLILSQTLTMPAFMHNVPMYKHSHPEAKVVIELTSILFSLWNLDFFRLLYPDQDICLDVSSLTVLALDYAVAIYPLLLTVVSYFLIELHARNVRIVVFLWKPFRYIFTFVRRNWDSRTTIIDAYATFFVLSYIKILGVSADLLIPIPVRAYSLTNDSVTWALYYDATVDYFGKEHLPYAILAIICLMVITVPTILLLLIYQMKCFQRLLNCLKIRTQLLPALMDSFQGSYKNGLEKGTRDYRWFVAVPFIGQVAILLIYLITLSNTFIPLEILIILWIMVLTACIQPYKTHLSKYAKIDIIFWGFLASFYASNTNFIHTYVRAPWESTLMKIIQIPLGLFPLLYMICVSAYWILSRMKKVKFFVSQLNARRRGYLNIENKLEEALPDRLVNPENYQDRENDLQDPTNYNDTYNDTY